MKRSNKPQALVELKLILQASEIIMIIRYEISVRTNEDTIAACSAAGMSKDLVCLEDEPKPLQTLSLEVASQDTRGVLLLPKTKLLRPLPPP